MKFLVAMRDPRDAADLEMILSQAKFSLDEAAHARCSFPEEMATQPTVGVGSAHVPSYVVSKVSIVTFVPREGEPVKMLYFSPTGDDYTIYESELGALPVPFGLLVQLYIQAYPESTKNAEQR